jgi:hypothetical protein
MVMGTVKSRCTRCSAVSKSYTKAHQHRNAKIQRNTTQHKEKKE